MRNRGKSDYGIQICAENQEGVKGCSGREKRIKMRKTWERLLSKDFGTKRPMFTAFTATPRGKVSLRSHSQAGNTGEIFGNRMS